MPVFAGVMGLISCVMVGRGGSTEYVQQVDIWVILSGEGVLIKGV
jgi:hypothetical protein